MRASLALTLLLFSAAPARARVHTERLGPLKVSGHQPAMEGPYITKSLEFPQDVLMRSLSVRLLKPDGSPDPDQSRLCHLTLAHAERTHVARLAPHLLSLDLGARRVELPRGHGLLLRGGERYLLNAMLASEASDEPREHIFEVALELEDAGGATRPLESVTVGLTAGDAHEHHATANYDWLVPPGVRRAYARRASVPRDLVVRGMSLHLHRYAVSASVSPADGGPALFGGAVKASPDGRLESSPALTGGRPLRLKAGADYRFETVYHNTGPSSAPVMGVFYLYVEPASAGR